MSESGRDEGGYDAESHDGDIGMSPSPSHRPVRRSSFTDTDGMAHLLQQQQQQQQQVGELQLAMFELATTMRQIAEKTQQSPASPPPQVHRPLRADQG